MAQLTINPTNAKVVQCEKGSSSWDSVHDETGTTGVTTGQLGATSLFISGTQYRIARGFLPFNTTSIPSGATIDSATLRIYATSKGNADNDGDDWINVVQTTQAVDLAPATADYDQCGSVDDPTEGATRIDIGSINTSAYNTWTLNATGLLWIIAGGNALLGLREGHDALDNVVVSGASGVTFQDEGDANPPELIVNFTPPPPSGSPIFYQ